MQKLFYVVGCLLVLSSSPVLAQTTDPDVVVVRVSEQIGASRMIITRGEGKSTTIDLPFGYSSKTMTESSETYYRVVTGLYKEGYTLTGVLKTGDIYTTILFTRIPKP